MSVEPATVLAPAGPDLDYIAREIRSRLEFGKKHEEKAKSQFASAGVMLADARPHFATKTLFELWCNNKIGMSISWAYELMARHAKPDEPTAMQRAQAAADCRARQTREAYRAKSPVHRTESTEKPRQTPPPSKPTRGMTSKEHWALQALVPKLSPEQAGQLLAAAKAMLRDEVA